MNVTTKAQTDALIRARGDPQRTCGWREILSLAGLQLLYYTATITTIFSATTARITSSPTSYSPFCLSVLPPPSPIATTSSSPPYAVPSTCLSPRSSPPPLSAALPCPPPLFSPLPFSVGQQLSGCNVCTKYIWCFSGISFYIPPLFLPHSSFCSPRLTEFSLICPCPHCGHFLIHNEVKMNW